MEHRGAVVSVVWARDPAVLRSKLSGATIFCLQNLWYDFSGVSSTGDGMVGSR